MAYLSLYRKYRPQIFEELLGQEHISSTLANAITEDRVAHAYLFTGPRGTGKTSAARILAKALNCAEGPTPKPCGKCDSCIAITEGSSLDVIEMDAASHSGVDKTREILSGVMLATAGGRRKVYVIDEVHMLSTPAFNALLKTLEEPPSHVVFVLATTEAHNVLATIVSRTQRFDFRPLSQGTLEAHLAHVAKLEGVEIEPDAIGLVARHAEGGARDALSVLDQLSSFEGRVTLEDVERLIGEHARDAFFDLFDAIQRGEIGEVFNVVNGLVAQGADARRLAEGALAHARSLLLLRTAPDAASLLEASDEDRQRISEQADRFTEPTLLRVLDLIAKSLVEMRQAPNHRLFLEVALVRAAAPDTDPSANGLLGRIERLERRSGIEGPAPEPQVAPAPRAQPSAPAPESRPQRAPRPRPSKTKAAPAQSPAPAQPVPTAQEPAPPAAPAPASDTSGIGLGHVRDAWNATMQEVNKRSRRVGAYLHSSRPLRLDDDGLQIEVQAAFHESAMKDESSRALLADALHAALGIRPPLLFTHAGAGPRADEPAATAASVTPPAHAAEPEPTIEDVAADDATDVDPSLDPVELVKRGLSAEVVEERDGAKG